MSNPLSPQNDLNRIPLLTCTDYAYNPWDYDPARSIGQAIVHLAKTEGAAIGVARPGRALSGVHHFSHGAGRADHLRRPAAIRRCSGFNNCLRMPHARFVADLYLAHVESVIERMVSRISGAIRDFRFRRQEGPGGNGEALSDAIRGAEASGGRGGAVNNFPLPESRTLSLERTS